MSNDSTGPYAIGWVPSPARRMPSPNGMPASDGIESLQFSDHHLHRSHQALRLLEMECIALISALRPKLLQEYRRTCRPGGVIRITEDDWVVSNSPALSRLSELFLRASCQAGHLFTSASESVTGQLVPVAPAWSATGANASLHGGISR